MSERPGAPGAFSGPVRRLSFQQARQELRAEAAAMTIPERLRAMTELNRSAFVIAEERARDPRTAFYVRRRGSR